MADIYPIATAMVISHDPEGGGVNVMFKSGQIAGHPVKMGYDQADGLRIRQRALPGKGTWGIVVFPNGDQRNGVWICSINSILVDAITSGPGDDFVEYFSHWSGYWDYLSENGDKSITFPDGTSITITESGSPAQTYRHIVDQNQQQQRIPVAQTDRIPAPAPAKIINITHASGTKAVIDALGNLTVTVVGASTVNVDGDSTVSVGGNASLSVSGTVTGKATSWSMTGPCSWDGNLTVTGTIVASSDISDNSGNYGTVNLIRTTYNSHYHGGVTTGTGNTDTTGQTLP